MAEQKFPKLDGPSIARRGEAMLAFVGLWRDRTDLPDTETYVRGLRRDTRYQRLHRDIAESNPRGTPLGSTR